MKYGKKQLKMNYIFMFFITLNFSDFYVNMMRAMYT